METFGRVQWHGQETMPQHASLIVSERSNSIGASLLDGHFAVSATANMLQWNVGLVHPRSIG